MLTSHHHAQTIPTTSLNTQFHSIYNSILSFSTLQQNDDETNNIKFCGSGKFKQVDFFFLSLLSLPYENHDCMHTRCYRIDNVYRSTCSIPAALNNNSTTNNTNTMNSRYSHHSAPDSPRSTRSAGWIKSQQRGLFGINSSPKSVRSASSRNGQSQSTNGHRHRSSSVESQSSNDSRTGRRHRSRSKRMSDNESEMSRGSGRSGRSHRKHRRHRSRGSERGGSSTRDYNYNEKYTDPPELIDSNKQWLEVQRKQAEQKNMGSVQQASVVKSNTAPKSSSNSTDTYSRNKKHRKHR